MNTHNPNMHAEYIFTPPTTCLRSPKHRLCPWSLKALGKMNEPPLLNVVLQKNSQPQWVTAPGNGCIKNQLPPREDVHRGAGCLLHRNNAQQSHFTRPKNPGIVQEALRKWNWYRIKTLEARLESRRKRKRKKRFRLLWSFGRNKMSKPNYSGTFDMVEQENMDSYLEALGKTLFVALVQLLLICNSWTQISFID